MTGFARPCSSEREKKRIRAEDIGEGGWGWIAHQGYTLSEVQLSSDFR